MSAGPLDPGGCLVLPWPRYRLVRGSVTAWADGSVRRAGRCDRNPWLSHPRTTVPAMARVKDMDRWLGDGGMALIGLVGAAFVDYGVDGEDLGWTTGTFEPSELACNPHGIVQAGVHALLLDAAMNFAINAALPGRSRTRGTLEMKVETMRPVLQAQPYTFRGDVVRMARQVAYGEATILDGAGALQSRSTGTFLLHRPED